MARGGNVAFAGAPELPVYEEAPRPIVEPGDALVPVFASAVTKDEVSWGQTHKTQQPWFPANSDLREPPRWSGLRASGEP